ncbi:MAG TPA: LTA synthase family protein [Ureibacillus sp.]|nr:LTA synthase family protein [Ureibacillus sp.]
MSLLNRYIKHHLFIIFTIIFLLKLYFARVLLFDSFNIFQTFYVEIGYFLVIFALFELLNSQNVKFILYVLLDLILSVLLLAVLLYKSYYGNMATVYAFSLLNQVGTVSDSLLSLFNPIYCLLFIDFVILVILAIVKKNLLFQSNGVKNYKFISGVVVIGLIAISGNLLSSKNGEIADTVVAAQKQGIFTSQMLTVASINMDQNTIAEDALVSIPEKILELKELTIIPDEDRKYSGIAEGKNVIAIQVEALQNFTIGLEVDGKEVTPYLNELIKDSIYFPNVYQQIGPGNTSDAEFIFNTSLYPNAWEATSEVLSDRNIPSLPKLLKVQGYTSITSHANDITFWNRNNLYEALGFDQYNDIEFFGQEDVIGIGPSDEVLYSKVMDQIKELYENDEKFYAQFVTLSSHHPFKIPSTKEVIELPTGFEGSIVGDYLKAVHYADFALGKFVQELKDTGLWEDTTLVIYGDHFGLQSNGIAEGDFALLNELIGHDYHFLDQFNIPLIVAIGDQSIGVEINTVGGQLDILPTVANILNLSLDDFVYFGQDLVNSTNNLFGMRYYMPVGSFFNNEITFKPKEGFGDGEANNINTYERLEDYSAYEEDYKRILELMRMSDTYVKSLPNR